MAPSTAPQKFDFIGYDLGDRQVQVTSLNRTIQASDGTRISLTRESWLPDENKRTSVALETAEGACLRCHETENRSTGLFHLTMPDGVIVAFERTNKALMGECERRS